MATNPMILGVDLEAAACVAVGVWGAQNLGALLDRLLPQGRLAIDNIRPGLGAAVYQLAGAFVGSQAIGFIRPDWRQLVGVGGGALAGSNALNAIVGQVDLVGGRPSLATLASLRLGPGQAPAAANGAAGGQLQEQPGLLPSAAMLGV